MEFAPIGSHQAELGESPVWSAKDDSVWWVDIPGKRVLQTFVSNGHSKVWATPEEVGFVVLSQTGRIICGMESGLFELDPETGKFDLVSALETRNVRFNDACTDDAGRLWAGTMHIENKLPIGVLYRIDADLDMTPMIDGFMTPNGLAYDPVGNRLFISDSHPDVQTVWTCDLDPQTAALGARREFATFHDLKGRPDGAALDADGNYWIAGVGGGVVHVFAPEGQHLAEYPTPFEAPTKPAFGGKNLSNLFLTSKGGPVPNGMLAVAPGPQGCPVSPFLLN